MKRLLMMSLFLACTCELVLASKVPRHKTEMVTSRGQPEVNEIAKYAIGVCESAVEIVGVGVTNLSPVSVIEGNRKIRDVDPQSSSDLYTLIIVRKPFSTTPTGIRKIRDVDSKSTGELYSNTNIDRRNAINQKSTRLPRGSDPTV